ncbi:M16 family metallopeptidase [Lacibacter sediminis]|uniref:Insulinase family protein n=1 Tax=Lacibacter sediminis TaxID=2760713 RepID=A0A7G5XGH2_9BACT|nr:pitrilysin family protein [Lacibacter sediminis]QNA44575.1 insulinase family protein [Lacibacter sediminis]
MLNRLQAPIIKDATEFDLKLKAYDKYVLDNGVEVYAVNAGTQEVLSLELVFSAGNWFEQQNNIAAATNYLIKNGTKSKTAFQLNEHFDYYGSHLSRGCYNETANIVLHCIDRHFATHLPVIAEMITDAIYPQHELDIYKQNMQQRLTVNLKKCDFVAGRLIDEYVFGKDHPYGVYSNKEDYDALQQEQLQDYYKKYYTEGKCIIFAAGLLPANFQQELNRTIGQLPLNQKEIPTILHPVTPAVEKKYRIANDPNGVQGAIRLAQPFPNRHHPDFQPVQVLNTLFGGFFGSRLMSNIREDKGYTYGIHSYILNHISTTAWMVSTEAGRDVSEATITEIYNEMKDLREELVDEEELQLVKNYLIGTILGDLDGPFHIIGRWKNLILNGLDEQYFYKSVNIIKNISAKELQELANKYLHPEKFYELVVV